jgi:hypothetical protein
MFERRKEITVKLLTNFCIVRSYSLESIPAKIPAKTIPKKRSELVQLAFDLRSTPISLLLPQLPINPPLTPCTNNIIDPSATTSIALLSTGELLRPNHYLKDESWRELLVLDIKGVKRMEIDIAPSADTCTTADTLVDVLYMRYESHFVLRNIESKRRHPCFIWSHDNLARVVAAMTYFDHVKPNLHRIHIGRNTTLLASPHSSSSAFMNARVEEIGSLQGCYLYYDNESGKWVRSGKTGGANGSHKNRNEEHKKNSKKRSNTFYQWFPDENITSSEGARGTWQGLHQYCGLSFDRLHTETITSVVDDEGVFHWDESTRNWIETIKKTRTTKEVQREMVAYLFELIYDLCIAPDDNASEYPGFESLTGTYKRDDEE